MNTSLLLQLFKDTLLLIPCSGAKQRGSKPSNALSILSALDPARAAALANARAALREKARVDEKTLMPAYLRYSGKLYEHGSTSIGGAIAAGQRVLIVSGGYGLLLADEPIGMYEKRFALSDWPGGLLEGCILDYARHEGIRSVIAVVSSTTDYAKLIRRVNWRKACLEVKGAAYRNTRKVQRMRSFFHLVRSLFAQAEDRSKRPVARAALAGTRTHRRFNGGSRSRIWRTSPRIGSCLTASNALQLVLAP